MKSVKNYVYTERAHFMCPNMHFGIMAKIESNYDEGRLKQSIDTLQKAHPFLRDYCLRGHCSVRNLRDFSGLWL